MGSGGQGWSPDCSCGSAGTPADSATPGEPADLGVVCSKDRESSAHAEGRHNARVFEEQASVLVQVPATTPDVDVDAARPAQAECLMHARLSEQEAHALVQVLEAPTYMEVDPSESVVRPEGVEGLIEDDGMVVEAPLEVIHVAPVPDEVIHHAPVPDEVFQVAPFPNMDAPRGPTNASVNEEAGSARLVIKLPARPSPPRLRRSARTTMRKEGFNS